MSKEEKKKKKTKATDKSSVQAGCVPPPVVSALRVDL